MHLLEHTAHPDRKLALAAAVNFRDLGGYPTEDGRVVRWRRLYRSAALHGLVAAPSDLDELRRRGLRTVVDLRTPEEQGHAAFPAERVDATYHHLPVIPTGWTAPDDDTEVDPVDYFTDRYLEMLEVGVPAFGVGLRLLADESSYPLVFHCTAGKDRTGVFAMLVLGLLGVDRDLIVADYQMSAAEMLHLVTWLRAHAQAGADAAIVPDPTSMLMAAPAEALHNVLDELVTRHGSVEGYVREIGLQTGEIDAIRDALLD